MKDSKKTDWGWIAICTVAYIVIVGGLSALSAFTTVPKEAMFRASYPWYPVLGFWVWFFIYLVLITIALVLTSLTNKR